MEVEEPAPALDAIEGRVPLDGLAHAGGRAHDERVEAPPDIAFPTWHGRDVRLHRGIAVALRDLRVAACEESRLCALRNADFGAVLRRVDAFATTRLVVAFFATFTDVLGVLPAIVFTPGLPHCSGSSGTRRPSPVPRRLGVSLRRCIAVTRFRKETLGCPPATACVARPDRPAAFALCQE